MAGKRRANGEGSITKRKDGRWMARYRTTDALGIRKNNFIYAKTKEEVARLLRQRLKEVDDGDCTIRDGKTLNGFYNYWKTDLAPLYLKETTIWGYDIVCQKYILPLLGKKKLTSLTPVDTQKLVVEVMRKTNSPKQCKNCHDILSSILRSAQEQHRISYNPTTGVKVPKYKPKEKDVWSLDELVKFLNVAKEHSRFYTLYAIMANYGLRLGEALGIRNVDIDLDSKDGFGQIHICQQIVTLYNKPVASTPKTDGSIRDLAITEEIASLIKPLLRQDFKGCDLLFHTSNNTPILPNNLRRDFNRIIKLANLRHATPHTLRHWACTEMNELGANNKTIQSIMGHSSLSTTTNIYEHTRLHEKAKVSNVLSKHLFGAMAKANE